MNFLTVKLNCIFVKVTLSSVLQCFVNKIYWLRTAALGWLLKKIVDVVFVLNYYKSGLSQNKCGLTRLALAARFPALGNGCTLFVRIILSPFLLYVLPCSLASWCDYFSFVWRHLLENCSNFISLTNVWCAVMCAEGGWIGSRIGGFGLEKRTDCGF